jgi:hypothetical protein
MEYKYFVSYQCTLNNGNSWYVGNATVDRTKKIEDMDDINDLTESLREGQKRKDLSLLILNFQLLKEIEVQD